MTKEKTEGSAGLVGVVNEGLRVELFQSRSRMDLQNAINIFLLTKSIEYERKAVQLEIIGAPTYACVRDPNPPSGATYDEFATHTACLLYRERDKPRTL
jgi:hypothetical protein